MDVRTDGHTYARADSMILNAPIENRTMPRENRYSFDLAQAQASLLRQTELIIKASIPSIVQFIIYKLQRCSEWRVRMLIYLLL